MKERGSALSRACELSVADPRMVSVVAQMLFGSQPGSGSQPDLEPRSIRPNQWTPLFFAVDGVAKTEEAHGSAG